jgi:hypothetical protein
VNALKIEDLHYNETQANEIVEVLKDFLINDIGYLTDWVQDIECRHRSGFIPYSNNKGGLQAHEYRSQLDFYFCPTTNFKAFNNACEHTYNYLIDNMLEEEKISKEDYEKGIDNDDLDMVGLRDEVEQSFGEYEAVCIETMLKMESTGNLYVGFFLNASDAPYFRGYDDSIEFDVKFSTIDELKTKLDKITDDKRVQEFIDILNY